ncbi:hypothetical protein ACFX13_031225 [Malus domestica]
MSKLFQKVAGFFTNRTMVGMDKAGNRYFARKEEVDGIMKEKRWVAFKGEDDPTSIPVEWICWLNRQRKRAPTLEELAELEARHERVWQNVALLEKEEEERKARECSTHKIINTDKARGPDLKSFIWQFPGSSEGGVNQEESVATEGVRNSKEKEAKKAKDAPESTELTGSGQTFRPGTWQLPT